VIADIRKRLGFFVADMVIGSWCYMPGRCRRWGWAARRGPV